MVAILAGPKGGGELDGNSCQKLRITSPGNICFRLSCVSSTVNQTTDFLGTICLYWALLIRIHELRRFVHRIYNESLIMTTRLHQEREPLHVATIHYWPHDCLATEHCLRFPQLVQAVTLDTLNLLSFCFSKRWFGAMTCYYILPHQTWAPFIWLTLVNTMRKPCLRNHSISNLRLSVNLKKFGDHGAIVSSIVQSFE